MSGGSSKLAKSGMRWVPWNWFQALSVSLLAWFAGAAVVALVAAGLHGWFGQSLENLNPSIANLCGQIISALVALALLGLVVTKRFKAGWQQLGFYKFKPLQALLLIAIATVLLLLATVIAYALVAKLAPSVNLDQEQVTGFDSARSSLELALAFVGLVVVAPFVEEIVFRGFMLPAFAQSFGFAGGAVATSLLFGLAHWQVNVAIATFVLGLLLAWLYKRTGSLWPAILFHSLKNLVAFVIIF